MRDRDDEDGIALNRVDDRAGKFPGETPPNLRLDHAPAVGMFENAPDGFLNGGHKPVLKSRLALSVEADVGFVLRRRFQMKAITHSPATRRARASATSPGMVSTVPCRISSSRRRDSSAQRWSMRFNSAASKLSTSRSASAARSSVGRLSASVAICSTVIDMAER